jgi:PASTA domain
MKRCLSPVMTALAVFLLAAPLHAAGNRTVKLTVNVVNATQEPVPGAKVTVTGNTGGPPINVQTGPDGSANVDVSLGAARWTEGWFSSPTIKVTAEKDSQIGTATINIRSKEFKSRAEIEVVRTVALVPPEAPLTATDKVRLTITVVDPNGKPVSGAMISITLDTYGPEVRPYDYRIETGVKGVATTEIATSGIAWGEGWLYAPTFDVQVNKESLQGEDTFKLRGGKTPAGYRYPEYVNRTIVVRSQTKGVFGANLPTFKVEVSVVDEEAKPVEGANVTIFNDSGRGSGDWRFPGQTGSDGKVTIAVRHYLRTTLGIEASREGYSSGRSGLDVDDKQIGRTLQANVALKKGPKGETVEVPITVKREGSELPVADAHIIFTGTSGTAMGAYETTTNESGQAVLRIPGYGRFDVSLRQDTFEPSQEQVQIKYGEERQPFTFVMKAKATGLDQVEVTVSAGDVKNGQGGYEPLKGAVVKIGAIRGGTDASGKVTLTPKAGVAETAKGNYFEGVNVTASADGYKSQTKPVAMRKSGRNMAGSGAVAFVLQPGEDKAEENTPIRVIAEVRQAAAPNNPIPGATVYLRLPGVPTESDPMAGVLEMEDTNGQGEATFELDETPAASLDKMRSGLRVQARKDKYIASLSDITAEQLAPSNKPRRITVFLKRDWADLQKAVDDLEPRVFAWNNDIAFKSQTMGIVRNLASRASEAKGKVEALAKEVEAARNAMTGVNGVTSATLRCKAAARLKSKIEAHRIEADAKEQALKTLLDTATRMADSCSSADEGEAIKTMHNRAIQFAGAIGALEKKAAKDGSDLKDTATEQQSLKRIITALERKIAEIAEEAKKAEEITSAANVYFNRADNLNETLATRRDALWKELTQLKATYGLDEYIDDLPDGLFRRVKLMTELLGRQRDRAFGLDPKPLKIVKQVDAEIQNHKTGAESILALFKNDKSGSCDIETMDDVVDAIGSITTSATIELGAAADLLDKAQACIKRVALGKATPSATPTDLVVVPSVAGAKSIEYMRIILNQAGFKSAFKAVTPKTKAQELSYADQDPKPGEKKPRGSRVTVMIYEKFQGTTAAAATAPPAPPLGAATSGTMPDLTGLTLDQAITRLGSNMNIGGDEIGSKPPTPEKALTIYQQNPAPNSTVPTDTPVVITVTRYGSAKESSVDSGAVSALQRVGAAEVKPNRREPFGPDASQSDSYSYGESSAALASVRKEGKVNFNWAFQGVPGSLSPDQTFTIAISGSFSEQPQNFGQGYKPTAWIEVSGLDVIAENKAAMGYLSSGLKASGQGEYKLKLHSGATEASIGLYGDFGIGNLATIKYGKGR